MPFVLFKNIITINQKNMNNQQFQPNQKPNQTIWIIAVVIVLAVAAYGIWTAMSGSNANNNTNTNIAVNQNANLNTNTNSAANTNTSTNENANDNTNSSVIDTSEWKTYTNEGYEYSVKYPREWAVSSEVEGTFTYIKPSPSSECFLKIHNPSFLGRGMESFVPGQDETVTVLGKEFIRKNWLNNKGDLVQFGFEIQKDEFLLGIEGFVDKSFNECENILESIYESLELI